MKLKYIFCALIIFSFSGSYGQNVGIGTGSPAAKLDITSTNSGVLIPRVALTATNIASPVLSPSLSTLVYNTATAGSGTTAVVPGFYYWNGSTWVLVVDNSSLSGATTVSNTSSANALNTTVNGVTGATVPIVNSIGDASNGNTLSTTVNGQTSTGAPIINTNALSLSGTTVTSTVNGVASNALDISPVDNNIYNSDGILTGNRTMTMGGNTLNLSGGNVGIGTPTPSTALQVNGTTSTTNFQMTNGASSGYVLQSDGSGNGTWVSPTSVGTTNTLTNPVNTITSTVNGIAATTSAVNTVGNTSNANTLSTTVNGVAGSTVPIINTNTSTWTQSGGLSDVVNGVSANVTPASGTVANVLGYNSTGTAVYQAMTSATHAVSNTSTANTLSTTVDGTTGSTVPIVNSIGNTSSVNSLSTTVNGVTSTTVPIINTNALSQNGTEQLISTINGMGSTPYTVAVTGDVTGNLGASTVAAIQGKSVTLSSLATNNLLQYNGTNWVNVAPGSALFTAGTGLSWSGSTLNSDWTTSGSNIYNNNSGNVGIGTTTPGEVLDVIGNPTFGAGTERLSMGSGSLAFNRRVATGSIYSSSAYAYQFQHTPSTTQGSDNLALQVYNTSGTNITPTALVVTGYGNVGIGTNTPGQALEVVNNNAIKIGDSYLSSGGNGGTSNYMHLANDEYYNSSTATWTQTALGCLYQQVGQTHNWYSHAASGGAHTMQMSLTNTLLSVTGAVTSAVGFEVSGLAPSGNYLRGNGTNFVASAILAGDLPAGSGNYIQNQSSAVQTAGYNINGNGTIGGNLSVGGTSYFGGYVTGMAGYSPTNNMIRLTPNLHLNASTGYAVIVDWDNGNSGTALNFRVGNGASADVFDVLANGNVGIGTTTPAAPLEVSSNGDIAYLQLNTSATTNNRSRINFSQNGTLGMEIGSDYTMGNLTDLYIYNRATGSTAAYFYPGNQIWLSARAANSDFFMNNSGNVGIGTTSPDQKLTVAGSVDIGTNYLDFGGNVTTNSTAGICWHTEGTPVGNYAIYRTAGAWTAPYSQLEMDWPTGIILNGGSLYGKSGTVLQPSGGNVGIGSTNTTYPLTVNGDIFDINCSVGGYIGLTGDLPGYAAGTYPTLKSTYSYLYISVGGAYSDYISAGGSIYYGSSRNKKENFHELDKQDILNKINGLEMYKWDYKCEANHAPHIGPIAQDFYAKFGLGECDTMVSYIDPAGVALVGVQALSQRVDELKSASNPGQITDIDDRVKLLETENAQLKSSNREQGEMINTLKAQIDAINQKLNTHTPDK